MTIDLLFSTPICEETIIDKDLTSYIKTMQKIDNGVKRSNSGGWHSKIFREPEREFESLWEKIEAHLNEFNRNMDMDGDVHITSMWFNINPKHTYNIPHNHPRSNYSGVYYVKTPENCGNIYFQNPNLTAGWIWEGHKIKQKNNMNMNSIGYKAQKDTLYIFPSYIQHYVGVNMSDEERISLSFNTNIR